MKKQLQKIVKKAGLFSALISVSATYAQTTTFNYTGGMQTYTVPAGASLIQIDCKGSQGAPGSSGGIGGNGARMIGTFTVTSGSLLNVYVGSNPGVQAGGEGTYVALGTTPYIIAGGGGGGGYGQNGVDAPTSTSGTIQNPITSGTAPLGGTSGSGGNAGTGMWGTGGGGGWFSAGTGGTGSIGGAILCKASLGTTYAGGAGGGYSGGGGVNMDSGWGTGGGGAGGSYNTGTNQLNTAGFNTGNGSTIITVLTALTISQTASITCNGDLTAALSATVTGGVGPYTYSWSPTGGMAATASGLGAGIYTCTATDGTITVTNTFTVTQPATFSVSGTASNSVICNGSSTTLTGAGASTYTWTGGVTNAVAFTPTLTNTYSLTGSNASGCASSNTAVVTVTVNNAPTVMAIASSSAICTGDMAVLTASTSATSYTWNTGATTISISVSPTITTTYTVNVTGTNGCVGMANVMVTVNACTAVQNLSTNSIQFNIYPNPNNGLFVVELTSDANVIVTNNLGQVLVSQTMNIGKHNIDIRNQASGIYFVKLTQNGNQQTIKLIKE